MHLCHLGIRRQDDEEVVVVDRNLYSEGVDSSKSEDFLTVE